METFTIVLLGYACIITIAFIGCLDKIAKLDAIQKELIVLHTRMDLTGSAVDVLLQATQSLTSAIKDASEQPIENTQ